MNYIPFIPLSYNPPIGAIIPLRDLAYIPSELHPMFSFFVTVVKTEPPEQAHACWLHPRLNPSGRGSPSCSWCRAHPPPPPPPSPPHPFATQPTVKPTFIFKHAFYILSHSLTKLAILLRCVTM